MSNKRITTTKLVMIVSLFAILTEDLCWGAKGKSVCSKVYGELRSLESPNIPEFWDTSALSDPNQYDPLKYIFAIHVVNEIKFKYSSIGKREIGDIKPGIFSSIVTNAKPRSFMGETGLILGFKPDHVVGASAVDSRFILGSFENKTKYEERFRAYRDKHPILSPREIINKSFEKYDWNNEILLRGKSSDGDPVRIKAVFIWGDSDGVYPTSSFEIETIRNAVSFAEKRGLPIVVFRGPVKRFTEKSLTLVRNDKGMMSSIYINRNFTKVTINFESTTDSDFFTYTRISLDRLKVNSEFFVEHKEGDIIDQTRQRMKVDPIFSNELKDTYDRIQINGKCGRICTDFFTKLFEGK